MVERILTTYDTITVVGASANPAPPMRSRTDLSHLPAPGTPFLEVRTLRA